MSERQEFYERAAELERFAAVPEAVLSEVVTRQGQCFWVFDHDAMPTLSGEVDPDRELAAELCAGCPVITACLELELRTAGPDTVGVWGAMSDADRRELYWVWAAHRGGEAR